jgi:hypothetical protein
MTETTTDAVDLTTDTSLQIKNHWEIASISDFFCISEAFNALYSLRGAIYILL